MWAKQLRTFQCFFQPCFKLVAERFIYPSTLHVDSSAHHFCSIHFVIKFWKIFFMCCFFLPNPALFANISLFISLGVVMLDITSEWPGLLWGEIVASTASCFTNYGQYTPDKGTKHQCCFMVIRSSLVVCWAQMCECRAVVVRDIF